ncbi:MAG: hypothetical protein H7251_06385 [Acetobacteraceae bacterium]|nr:hypothetical protein [Acetobacteraceae bacterium]
MHNFSIILSALQAAIAVVAARERTMAVQLAAMWGRIARMGSRLGQLVAQCRAGTLPTQRAQRARVAGTGTGKRAHSAAPKWFLRTVGHDAVAAGLQLQHLLTQAECVAFVAAVPQAGRILRPLLRMLGVAPLPAAVMVEARGPRRAASVPGNAAVVAVPGAAFGLAVAVAQNLDV